MLATRFCSTPTTPVTPAARSSRPRWKACPPRPDRGSAHPDGPWGRDARPVCGPATDHLEQLALQRQWHHRPGLGGRASLRGDPGCRGPPFSTPAGGSTAVTLRFQPGTGGAHDCTLTASLGNQVNAVGLHGKATLPDALWRPFDILLDTVIMGSMVQPVSQANSCRGSRTRRLPPVSWRCPLDPCAGTA